MYVGQRHGLDAHGRSLRRVVDPTTTQPPRCPAVNKSVVNVQAWIWNTLLARGDADGGYPSSQEGNSTEKDKNYYNN